MKMHVGNLFNNLNEPKVSQFNNKKLNGCDYKFKLKSGSF